MEYLASPLLLPFSRLDLIDRQTKSQVLRCYGGITMGVVFIALIQAVPVFLVGFLTGNRWALIVAAIVMAVIAAMTGSSRFLFADLIGVGLAVVLAWAATGKK
ncbi:MAG: hypothetical protein U1A72_02880 [Sulfuritalea sp.]|nr:hypothetical protein [Sulfuritalea sp.]